MLWRKRAMLDTSWLCFCFKSWTWKDSKDKIQIEDLTDERGEDKGREKAFDDDK